jgi:DNA-binding HxlR family transcriptional regulator
MVRDEQRYPPGYPARKLLDIVGDRWTPVVLYVLHDSPKRYSEVQGAIPDVSKKMLTQVLRALERFGLVHRTVYPVVPPRTEYSLTDAGKRLHEPVAALCGWATTNESFLDELHERAQRPPPSPGEEADAR